MVLISALLFSQEKNLAWRGGILNTPNLALIPLRQKLTRATEIVVVDEGCLQVEFNNTMRSDLHWKYH